MEDSINDLDTFVSKGVTSWSQHVAARGVSRLVCGFVALLASVFSPLKNGKETL